MLSSFPQFRMCKKKFSVICPGLIVKNRIKQKLHSGVGNHFKLDFLSQLELCATSAEKKLVRVWCEAERSSLLQNLCVPYVQDAHLFIHLTKERGVKYLKET